MITPNILALSIFLSQAYAVTQMKREFTKNGVTFVEMTSKEENGIKSSVIFPKEKMKAKNQEMLGLSSNELSKKIATCVPFKESLPHPMFPGESLGIQVHGIIYGKCKLTQTFPRGLNTCDFTEAQQKEIRDKGEIALKVHMTDNKTCHITYQ